MLNQKTIDNEISKLMQIKDATKKQLIQLNMTLVKKLRKYIKIHIDLL